MAFQVEVGQNHRTTTQRMTGYQMSPTEFLLFMIIFYYKFSFEKIHRYILAFSAHSYFMAAEASEEVKRS